MLPSDNRPKPPPREFKGLPTTAEVQQMAVTVVKTIGALLGGMLALAWLVWMISMIF